MSVWGTKRLCVVALHFCQVFVGMPRLTEAMEKCAFFLFGPHPKEDDQIIGPGGTGFLVSRVSETLPLMKHIYAVTNKHVINEYPWARLNQQSGGASFIKLDHDEWSESKTDDLVVADLTDLLQCSDSGVWDWDFSWIDESLFITPNFIERYDVGIGSTTIMLGLFADHNGGERNVPVGRFGNIAAMPNLAQPVRLFKTDPFVRPAYLNDMRSRSGFSGSPVWVWQIPNDEVKHLMPSDEMLSESGWIIGTSFLRFIGIHRGQTREEVRVASATDSALLQTNDIINIPSAMTGVIPCWEISHLLDDKTLTEIRKTRDERTDRKKLSATLAC